ncbi:hypothetical protein Golax_010880, partial [Gossypium laxum]|nr:hypothetical protein [Gossypium laxum]
RLVGVAEDNYSCSDKSYAQKWAETAAYGLSDCWSGPNTNHSRAYSYLDTAHIFLTAMDPIIRLLLLLASSFMHLFSATAQPPNPISRITVVGVVFCDSCSSNTFSRHSYFLPGVEVNIECKFKAQSPKTTEQMSVSVNRTTDKYGVYKLEIPHVDGVDCVEGLAIESLCQASLVGSKSKACDVPG